jgi:toxin ParE1/3/4
MPRVIFTPEAGEDLRLIGVFITEKASDDAAFEMVHSIVEKCQTIASFPSAGKRRDELLPNLRSFVVDPYLFF